MSTWTEKELKAELKNLQSQGELKQWSLEQKQLHRKEYYLIQEPSQDGMSVGLDQDREVGQDSFYVTVFVNKENAQQGSTRRQIFPSLDLKGQLQELKKAAHFSQEQSWDFPEFDKKPKVQPELCFQGIRKDLAQTSESILEDLNSAIASCDEGEFNSAELFVSKEHSRLTLSSGFQKERLESRIYSEVCFSSRNQKRESEEYLTTGWNMHPEQFDFQKMCQESASYAKHSLTTERPRSGTIPVLVGADVLSEILHDALTHLSIQSEYFKMPFIAEGKEFVPGFDGESFKMSLDPSLDYLLGSAAFDGVGRAQEAMQLVKNNKVVNNIASPKFAQYLGKKATSCLGNVVIEAKGVDLEELRTSDSQVLEILQFSGLFTSALDLTFSSEIRLARLYDNESGKVTYIKGGSLSGNLKENLKRVRWSKEKTSHNHCGFGTSHQGYKGPAFALLSDVSVSS